MFSFNKKSQDKNKRKSLKQNTAWMMAGNTYYAICQWLVLIILARLGGAEEVGIFTLALSLTVPVILFFELGLRAILATDVKNERDYTAYFAVRLASSLTGLIICIVIATQYGAPLFWTIVAVATFRTIESFSQMYYGYALQKEQLNRISISLIIRGTSSTVILAIVYILTNNISLSACAYTVSWFAVLIFYDRHNISEKLHAIDKNTLQDSYQILLSGVPLGTTAILGVLGLYIPRYFLEETHGAADLGIFASMAYFITIGNIAVYALGQSMMPVLARYHANGETEKFRKTVLNAFLLVLLMGIIGISAAYFIGEFVLNIVYGSEFAAHASILPVIAIAASITYLANIFGYAINSKRIFMAQAPAQLLVMTGSFLGSMYYIPTYGIDGAAYALVISSVIMFFSFLGIIFIYRNK